MSEWPNASRGIDSRLNRNRSRQRTWGDNSQRIIGVWNGFLWSESRRGREVAATFFHVETSIVICRRMNFPLRKQWRLLMKYFSAEKTLLNFRAFCCSTISFVPMIMHSNGRIFCVDFSSVSSEFLLFPGVFSTRKKFPVCYTQNIYTKILKTEFVCCAALVRVNLIQSLRNFLKRKPESGWIVVAQNSKKFFHLKKLWFPKLSPELFLRDNLIPSLHWRLRQANFSCSLLH